MAMRAIWYFYQVLGAVLIFLAIISVFVCGTPRRFRFGIQAVGTAAVLVYDAVKVICHALDLFWAHIGKGGLAKGK